MGVGYMKMNKEAELLFHQSEKSRSRRRNTERELPLRHMGEEFRMRCLMRSYDSRTQHFKTGRKKC
jgi:hypothetical protein